MSNLEMDAESALSAARSNELVQFKLKMDGLRKRLEKGNTQDKQLKKACQDFEAVFITKLWQQMRATVPKEGYLHSKEEEMYLSMFDKEFSEKLSQAGGIGLGDMLYESLSAKLKNVSRETLPSRQSPTGQGFKPESPGLLPPEQAQSPALTPQPSSQAQPPAPQAAKIEPGQAVVAGQPGVTPPDILAKVDILARQIELDAAAGETPQDQAPARPPQDPAAEDKPAPPAPAALGGKTMLGPAQSPYRRFGAVPGGGSLSGRNLAKRG